MLMRTARVWTLFLVAALALALHSGLIGCAAQSKGAPGRNKGTTDEGPFRPESLRIHPLTRIVERSGEQLIIEAHVEFFDAWGHPVKGRGILRFEVASGMPGGIGTASAGALLRAEIDIRDPEDASVRYYDSATRTYRLYLEGANPAPSASVTLTVTFIGMDDRVLRDSYTPGEGPRLSEPASDQNDSPPEGVDADAPPASGGD